MKNKVYVAGSWVDRANVFNVISYLRKNGIEITHDWTGEDEEGVYRKYAEDDRLGIFKADVLVLCNSETCSEGKFWECGLADAWGKPIIVYGEPVKTIYRHRVRATVRVPALLLEKLKTVIT
jgi:hypothetical protein